MGCHCPERKTRVGAAVSVRTNPPWGLAAICWVAVVYDGITTGLPVAFAFRSASAVADCVEVPAADADGAVELEADAGGAAVAGTASPTVPRVVRAIRVIALRSRRPA